MDINSSFRLVLEGEAGKEISQLPIFKLSENISASNFACQMQMAKPQDN